MSNLEFILSVIVVVMFGTLAWLWYQFPFLFKTYAHRQVLPMNTGGKLIKPGETVSIRARPLRTGMVIERIFISEAAGLGKLPTPTSDWMVRDVTVANRSQFGQSGSLPGDMFGRDIANASFTIEYAEKHTDVVLIVEYVGSEADGVPFYGSMIGTGAERCPRRLRNLGHSRRREQAKMVQPEMAN